MVVPPWVACGLAGVGFLSEAEEAGADGWRCAGGGDVYIDFASDDKQRLGVFGIGYTLGRNRPAAGAQGGNFDGGHACTSQREKRRDSAGRVYSRDRSG